MTNSNNTINSQTINRYITIGIIGAILVLTGDFLMGWGLKDPSLSGMEGAAFPYLNISNQRMLFSSLCGIIGVPISVIGHYGIYKLIQPYSKKYAKFYMIGLLGFLSCGGAGVHVSSIEGAYFYKYMHLANASMALQYSTTYVWYFLVPLYAILIISWMIMVYGHIRIIVSPSSPFTNTCLLSSMLVGTVLTSLAGLFGNHEVVNALMLGAFSVGSLWSLIAHKIILNKQNT